MPRIVDNCVRRVPGETTVDELIEKGLFDPNHPTCKACGKHFPQRCMGLQQSN